MALVVSVLTLLVSASPGWAQAQFSPLSILGNILTSVHRARRFQGLGGRFESLLRPHQLRSKFTSDSSFGDSNVYPHIVRFPYPQPIIQEFNYPSNFVKSTFDAIQETEEDALTNISIVEEPPTEQSILSSNIENEEENQTQSSKPYIKKIKKKSLRLRPNPQYAVEEFTYVPDPADNNGINYDQEDNEINSFGNNNIQVPPVNITKAPVFIENFENLRNITFRLTEDNRRNKRKEEAKQSKLEFKVTSNQVNFKKGLATETNSSLISEISSRLQCPELTETGFCSVEPGLYPSSLVARLMEECGTEALVRSWEALVPLDLDSLGDNTRSVISSQKDRDRPWSWTVSAYSKSQVCQSDLAFTQPSYARDTRGREVVVVQAGGVHQSVSVDTCLSPGSACPGLATCSAPRERSLCVQRFTHQYLLAIPVTGSPRHCPVITAVRFPSGCVCHAQTQQVEDIFGQKLV